MKCTHVKSSFPIAVGATITGVDDETYSSTGTPFSTICLANAESSQERTLQEDDISLAYEFSRKFPGYTADNLATKGIHEVQARRFVLVSAECARASQTVCYCKRPTDTPRFPRSQPPHCQCYLGERSENTA